MLADLELLLIAVFCTADDLLPKRAGNARRRVTDAEVVTLCVAQAIMGIPSDPRFLAVARERLGHLFPARPGQPGFHKRRARLADTIEAPIAEFARLSPASTTTCCWSTRRPSSARARSRRRAARAWGTRPTRATARATAASSGAFACTAGSRPTARRGSSPKTGEREVALGLLARCGRGGETLIGDKGYAGAEFEASVAALGARILRPRRKDEAGRGPHLAPIRQRIESIFWSAKDILTLERHGARSLHGLRARLSARFLAPTAAIDAAAGLRRADPRSRAR